MRLFLSFFFLLGIACAQDCPKNYQSNHGTCIRYGGSTTYADAHADCAKDGAFLLLERNKTEMSNNPYITTDYWLGLTCLDESGTDSCVWDNGETLTYTAQFKTGTRQYYPCIYKSEIGWTWYNDSCTNFHSYICEIFPNVKGPDTCDDGWSFFNNFCYKEVTTTSMQMGHAACNEAGAEVASIHNEGVNEFVRELSARGNNVYSFLGLTHDTNGYSWLDGSAVNYTNFGFENTDVGWCVSMATQKDIVKQGQWVNSPCESSDSSSSVVCQKKAEPYGGPTPTLAPPVCDSPQYLNGTGTIYSPGFPFSSQNSYCTYVITEPSGNVVGITFSNLTLDTNGKINLFNNMLDSKPFVSLTNTTITTPVTYKTTGVMLKMVYLVTSATTNYFKADYGGIEL